MVKVFIDLVVMVVLVELDVVLIGGGLVFWFILDVVVVVGIMVVCIYGMSEILGGCVYDGVLFDGVWLRVLVGGCIVIGGVILVKGYCNLVLFDLFVELGWFYIDDFGVFELGDLGVLIVLG